MLDIRRKLVMFGLILSALFLIAARFLQEFGTIEEVLLWVVIGGGAMVLFGYFEALFLENLPFWHNLPVNVKRVVPLVFAGLLGFAAQAALEFDLPSAISPQIEVVILMLINWVFSQRALMSTKVKAYGAG